jgi:hypothetical protein
MTRRWPQPFPLPWPRLSARQSRWRILRPPLAVWAPGCLLPARRSNKQVNGGNAHDCTGELTLAVECELSTYCATMHAAHLLFGGCAARGRPPGALHRVAGVHLHVRGALAAGARQHLLRLRMAVQRDAQGDGPVSPQAGTLK